MPLINNLYFKFRNSFSQRFPKIYCFCDKRKSIVKFFISGCFVGLSDLIFLFIFHGIFKLGIVISTSSAFLLSFFISFTLQKFWTFRNYSQRKAITQVFLYCFNAIIGLSANGFLMHYFVNGIQVWYILAQIIVNLILGTYNFFIYKFIIFKIGCYEINCQEEAIE